MTTPLLALKELSVSQAAKEADHNETCRDLELFANLRFLDRDLATPPGSPAESDAYLVAGSPTGAWAGQAGNIAWYRGGAWKFHAPYEGLVAWVNDEGVFLAYDGALWSLISGTGSLALYQLSDVDLPISAGQADGTVLTWDAAGQVWVASPAASVGSAPVQTDATTNYDVAAADVGDYIRLTNAAAKTVTVRPDSTEALPSNGEWHFRNVGAGDATITAGVGVTINAPAGGTLIVPQGGTVTLKRVTTDEFDLFGLTT